MIQLRIVGESEIRIGRKVITPGAEVVFALGVYLCVRAGDRLSREEVTETFWGTGRESQARHSLRQMLYRLRQKGFTLDEDGEELYLDPARVDSDLTAVLSEGWPAAATTAEAMAAGQLAPGFTRAITERFQAWFDGVRDRLAAQHRRACLQQISRARREGRWADLDRWALEVLRTDPLNEEATLARAESAAISGSKAVALEIIDAYMEELGERAPVIGLPASVLRRRIAERPSDWSTRGPRDVPLVGRTELMSRLTGYVDAAGRGNGSSVLLWGAPGIGKTRLAEEVAAYAGVRGFRVVSVRASSASKRRPLALLLSLVPQLLELPGALGCAPDSLSVLTKIASQGANVVRAGPARSTPTLREALADSLTDLVDAVTAECKLILLTDDLHNIDDSSSSVIGPLLASLGDRRMLHLGTSRSRDSFPAQRLVSVPPLEGEEATALAEAFVLACPWHPKRQNPIHIARASGGNPLFVRELAFHEADREGHLPGTLHALMTERLESLHPQLLRALRLIAVLGGQLSTASRLSSLLGDAQTLSEALAPLDEIGLLRVGEHRSFELHECWQQTVIEEMRPVVRTSLAHECATLLSTESPLSFAAAWRAGTLYKETSEPAGALAMHRVCAEELMIRGLPAEAVDVLNGILDVAQSQEDRLQLLTLRAWAERELGDYDAVLRTCESALPLVPAVGSVRDTRLANLLVLQTEASWKTFQQHVLPLDQLVPALSNNDIDWRVRHEMCLFATIAVLTDVYDPIVETFHSHSRLLSHEHGASLDGLLTDLIYQAERGDAENVLLTERRLVALDENLPSLESRCRVLRFRAAALRCIGSWDESRLLGERCFQLARQGALRETLAATCDIMVHGALDANDLADAELWMTRYIEARYESASALRRQAFQHAHARILVHREEYAEAHSILEAITPNLPTRRMRRGRGANSALMALCAAMRGDRDCAVAATQIVEEISRQDRASLQSDIATELLLRAAHALGDHSTRERIGVWYAHKRREEFPAAIAPFFSAVQSYYSGVHSSHARMHRSRI